MAKKTKVDTWPEVGDRLDAILTLRARIRSYTANPELLELLHQDVIEEERKTFRSLLERCQIEIPIGVDAFHWLLSDHGKDVLAQCFGRAWDRPRPTITTEQIRNESLEAMKNTNAAPHLPKSTVRGWTRHSQFPDALPGSTRAKAYPRDQVREWLRIHKGILIE